MGPMMGVAALVLGSPAWALTVGGPPRKKERVPPPNSSEYTVAGDYVYDSRHLDAKPGSPPVPVAPDDAVLRTLGESFEPWRRALGERLLRAASAHDAMQRCESFVSLADYTWCRHAMPAEGDPGFLRAFGHVHEYNLSARGPGDRQRAPPDGLAALSYGIQGGDLWSEFMSGMYLLKTDLFDCFYEGKLYGPIPNDFHANHSRSNPCRERSCYTESYQVHKVCLDDSTQREEVQDAISGRRFQSLSVQLRDRKPLSTHLKMDIEGSEWPALERLLGSEADMAKIRTLDMEVHFNLEPNVVDEDKDKTENVSVKRVVPTKETITRHVETIERLAQYFAVSGSTIENDMVRAVEHFEDERKRDPHFITIPSFVASRNGLRLDQYCISFVNRKLL